MKKVKKNCSKDMNSNVKQIIKATNMIMYTQKNEIVELLERFFFKHEKISKQ